MTEREQDHYEALQVLTTADPEVIEAAYTRLVSRYDPAVDDSTEAAERVLRLHAAFEVLSDPVRRAEYDAALREAGPPAEPPSAGPPPEPAPEDRTRPELPAIDPSITPAERAFPVVWAGMLTIVCIIGIVRAWQHIP